MSKNALRRSLGAVSVVFHNREMRLLQLSWAAQSLAIWSFAIALGVYAFDASGATAVGIAGLVRLLPGAVAAPFGGLMGRLLPLGLRAGTDPRGGRCSWAAPSPVPR